MYSSVRVCRRLVYHTNHVDSHDLRAIDFILSIVVSKALFFGEYAAFASLENGRVWICAS